MKLKISILIATLATALTTSVMTFAAPTPIIMGYYAEWDTYHGYPFPGNAVGGVNPTLSTNLAGLNTLAYAFLEVDSNGIAYFPDPNSDLSAADNPFCSVNAEICNSVMGVPNQGNFDAFAKVAGKTLLISIGGAGSGDQSWLNAMNHPQSFIASMQKLQVQFPNVNGIDIDYEPQGGIPADNIRKFVDLVSALRSVMGQNFVITYTIIPNLADINNFGASNWASIVANINYINIMGYDMFGAFNGMNAPTDLQSGLYPALSHSFSDDAAIQALKANGVPAAKLILGYPSYGRAVGGIATGSGINQPFTTSFHADLDDAGCSLILGSPTMCTGTEQYATLVKQGYQAVSVNVNGVVAGVYANAPDPNNANAQMFVTYDSPLSVTSKAAYVLQNGLAGMMTWDINWDLPANNANSLLGAVDKAFNVPVPAGPQVQVELTNNGSESVIVSFINSGNYYAFPVLDVHGDQQYCNTSIATPTCLASGNLDSIGNGSVQVQVTSNGVSKVCPGSLTLTNGYHHIIVNYDNSNPSGMCALS